MEAVRFLKINTISKYLLFSLIFTSLVACSQGSTELNLTKGRASGEPGYPVFTITDASSVEANAGTSTLTFTITAIHFTKTVKLSL